MRLDKFICQSTDYSKIEALALLNAQAVVVNGEFIKNGATQVHENNTITLHGEVLTPRACRYIMLHKPAGTICSNVDEHYPSVFNHLQIEYPNDLHVVGRLDADTTGLVLITDDGRWSYGITHPDKHCPKVYRVGLSRPLADDVAAKFTAGIALQGETQLTLPASLTIISPQEVLLTITQGKFHQVKRMFAAVGNRVITLHRESIGQLQLDIPEGQWRYLTVEEIQSLR
ncbi:MAG: pseudouridine synthase [Glaciecola sp.]|jgi:16S rRNA pseudouridine516 synthase|nr:pseudouridine synthase [Glaciecola sp.]MDG1815703.1 pseudouridine synthase [Glaciecola sp.]MDG2099141.1 pseudouridine synthase [Glaciecola sp.]